MSLINYTSVLLLVVLSILFINIKSEEQDQAIEKLEHIFQEIKQGHDRLKQVLEKTIIRKTDDTPPQRKCKCVPYYRCKAEQRTIIVDGESLLESRNGPENEKGDNPCENLLEVCCMPPGPELDSKISGGEQNRKCGYGMKTIDSTSDSDQSYAQFGEYPWTIMIAALQKNGAEYKCVGSLIHPQIVLTAAHCVNINESILLRAGVLNKREKDEPLPHQSRFVYETIKHPKFKLANLKYNVALVVALKPFNLDDNVNTACLPTAVPSPCDYMVHECVATGWGIDKPKGNFSDIMRKIKFSLIDNPQCQNDFRRTRLGELFKLHKTFLCAFHKDGSDTCEGNGGGPLVCPIPNQSGRYQQVGITSWGLDCASNIPSVYTNVPEIKGWIDEQFDNLGFSKDYYTFETE